MGRTATIPFEESINLAVRAFIRHRMTDYDKLLREGMQQKEARQKIRSKVEKIVEEWKGRTGQPSKPTIPPTKTKPQSKNKIRKPAKAVSDSLAIEIIDLTSD